MAEDQVVRLEHMERAHQELQEKHAKACEDISRMIEMLITLIKGKQNEWAFKPQAESTPLRNTGEDSSYPHGFTLPRETQAIYASLS